MAYRINQKYFACEDFLQYGTAGERPLIYHYYQLNWNKAGIMHGGKVCVKEC